VILFATGSPDGAQAKSGGEICGTIPDFATLHPGYTRC
jgi:hypothetical protein